MSLPATTFFLAVITIGSCLYFGSHLQLGKAVLYENGTCTNEFLTNSSNQTINSNETVGDFLKSLPSDNTILAELVCNSKFNQPK